MELRKLSEMLGVFSYETTTEGQMWCVQGSWSTRVGGLVSTEAGNGAGALGPEEPWKEELDWVPALGLVHSLLDFAAGIFLLLINMA